MRFLLLALIASFFSSCSDKKPVPGTAPNYQTMHRLTFKGAMFHFNHQGKYYIGCSIHQGGMGNGAQLLRDGQENAVVIKKRVHMQKDLHVWTYDESTLSPDTALPYLSNPDIRVGDKVYILNKKKRIAATVHALPRGNDFRYFYQTSKPFPAGGMSGSPVFSVRTGTVVGILQTADSKTKATRGGFEALKMP